jgi:hypothetical protein
MNGRVAFLAVLSLCAIPAPAVRASEISPEGRRLVQVLDSMDVEHRWPAGVHVTWQTGIPDGKPEHGSGKHTHCSAFVASAAQKLGVYILRPPDHSETLLANAQFAWLADEGAKHGWRSVADAAEAQRLASQGWLVVATYHNHHDDMPGHIAIVRPSDKPLARVREEGPQIIQAGGTNYSSTSLAQGFAGHPAAWKKREVRFYAHAVEATPEKAHGR